MLKSKENTNIMSTKKREMARALSVIIYAISIGLFGFFVYIGYGGLVDGSVSVSKELFISTAVLAVVVAVANGWLLFFYRRLWAMRLVVVVALLVLALLAYGLTTLSLEGKIAW